MLLTVRTVPIARHHRKLDRFDSLRPTATAVVVLNSGGRLFGTKANIKLFLVGRVTQGARPPARPLVHVAGRNVRCDRVAHFALIVFKILHLVLLVTFLALPGGASHLTAGTYSANGKVNGRTPGTLPLAPALVGLFVVGGRFCFSILLNLRRIDAFRLLC